MNTVIKRKPLKTIQRLAHLQLERAALELVDNKNASILLKIKQCQAEIDDLTAPNWANIT